MKVGDKVKLVRYLDDPIITIEAAAGCTPPVIGATGTIINFEDEMVIVNWDRYDAAVRFDEDELEVI